GLVPQRAAIANRPEAAPAGRKVSGMPSKRSTIKQRSMVPRLRRWDTSSLIARLDRLNARLDLQPRLTKTLLPARATETQCRRTLPSRGLSRSEPAAPAATPPWGQFGHVTSFLSGRRVTGCSAGFLPSEGDLKRAS